MKLELTNIPLRKCRNFDHREITRIRSSYQKYLLDSTSRRLNAKERASKQDFSPALCSANLPSLI
jgi:hypothetical protein